MGLHGNPDEIDFGLHWAVQLGKSWWKTTTHGSRRTLHGEKRPLMGQLNSLDNSAAASRNIKAYMESYAS
jgi:hypothetical protein